MPDPVRDTVWVDWDYALADAVNAMDAMTGPSGQPRWLSEDPDVYWEIGEAVDYGTQQLAQEGKKYKEGVPQELSLYVKNPIKTTGEFWTMEEWLDWKDSHEATLDRTTPEGAHAPTPEENIAVMEARKARLKALYDSVEDDPVN